MRTALIALLITATTVTGIALAAQPDSGRPAPAVRVASANGAFSQSNSKDSLAILSAARLVPGQSTAGTVTIANDGDEAQQFTLTQSAPVDTPGPYGGNLSGRLDLVIADVSTPSAPVAVYSGPLASVGAQSLGVYAAGTSRTYRFTVSFPARGASDDAAQGSAVSVGYEWDGEDPSTTGAGTVSPTGEMDAPSAGSTSDAPASGAPPAVASPARPTTAAPPTSDASITRLVRSINPEAETGRLAGGSTIPSARCTIVGTSRSDRINGTRGNDVICGLGGNDRIDGRGGNDVIDTGAGNDTAFGGSGTDTLLGLAGSDRLSGGSGSDRLGGGAGTDRMSGGSGDDRMAGSSGKDRMRGDAGRDRISGNRGDDRLDGSGGNDRLVGDGGNDVLGGGSGNDRLVGSDGADRLHGGDGGDVLLGSGGRDRLTGAGGRDIFSGGAGRDRKTDHRANDRV